MSNNTLTAGLVIAIVIAIGGYFFPQIAQLAGAVGTRFPDGISVGTTVAATKNKLTVGTSGTPMGNIIYGTCTLKFDGTLLASSTTMVDCASSSFAVGDTVDILGLATSSVAASRTITINGTGSASTTAGFAPVRVTVLTGTTLTPGGAGLGSSTPFMIMRP